MVTVSDGWRYSAPWQRDTGLIAIPKANANARETNPGYVCIGLPLASTAECTVESFLVSRKFQVEKVLKF